MAREILAKFARLAWIRAHKSWLEYTLLSMRASLFVAVVTVLYSRRGRVVMSLTTLGVSFADCAFGDGR